MYINQCQTDIRKALSRSPEHQAGRKKLKIKSWASRMTNENLSQQLLNKDHIFMLLSSKLTLATAAGSQGLAK